MHLTGIALSIKQYVSELPVQLHYHLVPELWINSYNLPADKTSSEVQPNKQKRYRN